jgi:hypothetical protein
MEQELAARNSEIRLRKAESGRALLDPSIFLLFSGAAD